MVLVIDNYDSFTYNLVQYLGELGAEVHGAAQRRGHARRDRRAAARRASSSRPGPGRPEDAGHHDGRDPAVRRDDADPRRLPRAPGDRRGVRRRASSARACRCTARRRRSSTTAAGVFAGIAGPFAASRYHSLVVAEDGAAAGARGRRRARDEDGTIMGLRHRTLADSRRAVPSRVDPDRRRPPHPAQLPRRSAGA